MKGPVEYCPNHCAVVVAKERQNLLLTSLRSQGNVFDNEKKKNNKTTEMRDIKSIVLLTGLTDYMNTNDYCSKWVVYRYTGNNMWECDTSYKTSPSDFFVDFIATECNIVLRSHLEYNFPWFQVASSEHKIQIWKKYLSYIVCAVVRMLLITIKNSSTERESTFLWAVVGLFFAEYYWTLYCFWAPSYNATQSVPT